MIVTCKWCKKPITTHKKRYCPVRRKKTQGSIRLLACNGMLAPKYWSTCSGSCQRDIPVFSGMKAHSTCQQWYDDPDKKSCSVYQTAGRPGRPAHTGAQWTRFDRTVCHGGRLDHLGKQCIYYLKNLAKCGGKWIPCCARGEKYTPEVTTIQARIPCSLLGAY